MNTKTEEFLNLLLWSAHVLTRPSFRNLSPDRPHRAVVQHIAVIKLVHPIDQLTRPPQPGNRNRCPMIERQNQRALPPVRPTPEKPSQPPGAISHPTE
jgi:hypothetical protein